MRQLRNKNSLFALSWLAILLAATASADVVEDLVFEPFEANAAESPLPQPDLEDPAENATVPSVSGHVPDVKTAGPGVGLAGSAGGLAPLPSVPRFSSWLSGPLTTRYHPPWRVSSRRFASEAASRSETSSRLPPLSFKLERDWFYEQQQPVPCWRVCHHSGGGAQRGGLWVVQVRREDGSSAG